MERATTERNLAHLRFARAEADFKAAEDALIRATETVNSVKHLLERQGHEVEEQEQQDANTAIPGHGQTSPDTAEDAHVAVSDLSVSTRHLLEILSAAPGPLRPVEVFREFEKRNWVEQQWKAPQQSVYNLLVRAERNGLVTRTQENRWRIAGPGIVVTTSGTAAGSPR